MVLISSSFLQIKFELNLKVEVLWNVTNFSIYLNALFHVVISFKIRNVSTAIVLILLICKKGMFALFSNSS